jgi:hypothetical protein
MDAATQIRHRIAEVSALRAQQRQGDEAGAVQAVKALQSQRFRGSYADLLATPRFAPATQFFLQELYGSADYQARDAQFARIAGTLQTLFPQAVVDTAVALAQLHALTEQLDHAMALAWPQAEGDAVQRYVAAWRSVGQAEARRAQLDQVMRMGRDLAELTRKPGLRTLLRMMRGPAQAAGMEALQRFLEAGFDTFGALSRSRGALQEFLGTIEARESALMQALFEEPPVACETRLRAILGQAR